MSAAGSGLEHGEADQADRFDVVVVGSLNLDLVVNGSRIPMPGETVLGDSYHEYPGGKGLNQAVAAARAGARVAMLGAVGDDAAGRDLRSIAAADGIVVDGVATIAGVPTGRAVIVVDEAAENSIVVIPGANAEVTPEMAARIPLARVVLGQLEVPPEIVAETFRLGRAAGAVTVLNPAPADSVPAELLELADVVVPNQHELALVGGREQLAAAGVQTLIVTLGAAGVDVVDVAQVADVVDGGSPDDTVRRVEPYTVDAVDTTGAGDAFCGGLAARLAAGDTIDQAVRFAAANGALATTRPGAVPSLPRQAETLALIADSGSLTPR